MLETFESWDRAIVLAVNGANHPVLDVFFWIISSTLAWIPVYLILAHFVWKTYGWQNLLRFIGIVVLLIAVTDAGSTHLFKDVFLRYRPSHNSLLEGKLHFYYKGNGEYYKGGQYGFISSHAANFFAICFYVGLTLKDAYPKLKWILFGAALLVCYSRLYLGVHYLSDLVAGALWGSLWGIVFYKLFERVKRAKS